MSEELLIWLQMTMLLLLVWFVRRASKHGCRVEQHMKESDRRFYALARDFKKHIESDR
jgi:hypothetical protein